MMLHKELSLHKRSSPVWTAIHQFGHLFLDLQSTILNVYYIMKPLNKTVHTLLPYY